MRKEKRSVDFYVYLGNCIYSSSLARAAMTSLKTGHTAVFCYLYEIRKCILSSSVGGNKLTYGSILSTELIFCFISLLFHKNGFELLDNILIDVV